MYVTLPRSTATVLATYINRYGMKSYILSLSHKLPTPTSLLVSYKTEFLFVTLFIFHPSLCWGWYRHNRSVICMRDCACSIIYIFFNLRLFWLLFGHCCPLCVCVAVDWFLFLVLTRAHMFPPCSWTMGHREKEAPICLASWGLVPLNMPHSRMQNHPQYV